MNDRAGGVPPKAAIASDVAFGLLLVFGVVRTLRHAMWRDELQAFQISAASPTLLDLFHHLKYEARPPLWDLLLWSLTRLTADPIWMQVLHAAIAAAIWIVVYRFAPFGRLEKFLLLASYFLFFEYFVVSRSYALAVLCGFGFVALRQHRPSQVVLAWLALGLMANLVAHATIWSIALALVFALEERRRDAPFLGGAAIYLALLAFGVVTMMPAPDFGPWNAAPGLEPSGIGGALVVMLGAFVPFDPGWLHAAAAFLADPHTAPVPFVWNPNPVEQVLAVTQAHADHPARLAALLIIPIALCAALTRNRYRVLEFSLAYGGIMLFAVLWHFPGNARHHGLVFLALVASVWIARARTPPTGMSWLFAGLLAINAFGGVLTLGSEFNTFSQSRNTARWIEQNNLSGLPLIGSRDAQVSSVAGYLGRPVYYLECQCSGTFIVWNSRRQSPLSQEQFHERLSRAVLRTSERDSLLVLNRPLSPQDEPLAGFTVMPLQSFVGSLEGENYWLYRVTRAGP